MPRADERNLCRAARLDLTRLRKHHDRAVIKLAAESSHKIRRLFEVVIGKLTYHQSAAADIYGLLIRMRPHHRVKQCYRSGDRFLHRYVVHFAGSVHGYQLGVDKFKRIRFIYNKRVLASVGAVTDYRGVGSALAL